MQEKYNYIPTVRRKHKKIAFSNEKGNRFKSQRKNFKAPKVMHTVSTIKSINESAFSENFSEMSKSLKTLISLLIKCGAIKSYSVPKFEKVSDLLDFLDKKIEKTVERKGYDFATYDGETLSFLSCKEKDSFVFYIKELERIEDNNFKRVAESFFGMMIKKHGFDSCFNSYLFVGCINNILYDFYDDSEVMSKEETLYRKKVIERVTVDYANPLMSDFKKIKEGKCYKLIKKSIETYMKQDPRFLIHYFLNESGSKATEKQIEFCNLYQELLKYDYQIDQFFLDEKYIEQLNYHYLMNKDYCMIAYGYDDEDKVYENFENYLNEIAGNSGVIPLFIKKEYSLDKKTIREEKEKKEKFLEIISKLQKIKLDD